jgi:ADP-ribosyltransferase exoenzyme
MKNILVVESWSEPRYIDHKKPNSPHPVTGLTKEHANMIENHDENVAGMKESSKKYSHKLSHEEAKHIASYQIGSYKVNDPLRNKKSNKIAKEHTHSLDKATDHELPNDLMVYRGVHHSFADSPAGTEITDHGFTGTTVDPKIGNFFAGRKDWTSPKTVARIFLKKGQKGNYLPNSKTNLDKELSPITHQEANVLDREHEFLLPRGTRFKILGHSRGDDGEHYINMEAHQLTKTKR